MVNQGKICAGEARMRHTTAMMIRVTLTLVRRVLLMGPLPVAAKNACTSYGPEGGTVQVVAIDPRTPTTLYAGIKDSRSQWSEGIPPSGKLFKTTDGGRSWRAANTGLPNTEITAISINPHTPTTIYVGVAGGQTFKSIDGGGTWSGPGVTVSGVYPALSIARVAFDPQTQTTIYAAGGNSIVKSTDGGSTWRTLSTGLSDDVGVSSIAIDPKTPTTLYVGLSSFRPAQTRGVFKSTDGAETWHALDTDLANSIVTALVVDTLTPSTIYMGTEVTGIFKSSEGGDRWHAINTGLPSLGILPVAFDPQKPNIIYGRAAGVFKSTDGGGTWRAVHTGLPTIFINDLAVDPKTPTTLYVGTYGSGVYKSTDGAASWHAVTILGPVQPGVTRHPIWYVSVLT